jgi:hypothetical protein
MAESEGERLVVVVECAESIRNTQSFGSQDPYVSVSIDGDQNAAAMDTVLGGGTEPVWGDDLKKRVCLPLEGRQKALFIRLWHKSTFLADDSIGCLTLDLETIGTDEAPTWHELDTGGKIKCAIYRKTGGEDDVITETERRQSTWDKLGSTFGNVFEEAGSIMDGLPEMDDMIAELNISLESEEAIPPLPPDEAAPMSPQDRMADIMNGSPEKKRPTRSFEEDIEDAAAGEVSKEKAAGEDERARTAAEEEAVREEENVNVKMAQIEAIVAEELAKKEENAKKAAKEAEEQAENEAEEQAAKEAEEQAAKEAEEQAAKEAEEQTAKEAEEQTAKEAEEQAAKEAEEQAAKEAAAEVVKKEAKEAKETKETKEAAKQEEQAAKAAEEQAKLAAKQAATGALEVA